MKTCRAGNGRAGGGTREEGRGGCPLPPSPFPSSCHVILALALVFAGCAYYSFTGATIPERFDTIAIPLATDDSRNPLPTLDEALTERLTNRFVQQTRLALETNEADADVVLSTRITRYVNEPTAVRGDERAAQNRVTIAVAVRYVDQVEDRPLIDRTFTSFEQYDPVADGPDGEEAAALAALDNIADDVFTAATSNW
jgi:hypothetical protein